MPRPTTIDDYGDLDCITSFGNNIDSPPGTANDPDAIPAAAFMLRMEKARSARAKEIRKTLGEDADDIPDRFPEGWFQSMYLENGKRVDYAGPMRRRGRVKGSKDTRPRNLKPKEVPPQ